ncbi:MAG: WG repeat-containing protein [Coleofasciculaceae cyanobacterium SM2_1_6]|nr:WG repeat-containing protein [Coleofasciculaceae cyanobacterium SM2_1_6]
MTSPKQPSSPKSTDSRHFLNPWSWIALGSGSTILLLLSGVGAWTIASQLLMTGKASVQNQSNLSVAKSAKSLDVNSNIPLSNSDSADLSTLEESPTKRTSATSLDLYLSNISKQFASENNFAVTGYSRLRNRFVLVNAVDDRPTKLTNTRLRSKQKTPEKPAEEIDKPANENLENLAPDTNEPTSQQERINQTANSNPANSTPNNSENLVADGGSTDLSGKEGGSSESTVDGSALENTSFDWGWNFSEGLAEVRVGEKWGYIDRLGRMVIRPRFQEAKYFSEGLASVKVNDRWGYIDRKGNMVIPADFQEASEFSEGLAAVKLAGSWGYIDKAGKFVVQPQYQDAGTFHEGLASVQIDSLWGYIDPSGLTVISPKFNNTWGFSQGIAQVKLGNRNAYIDREGNFISGRP